MHLEMQRVPDRDEVEITIYAEPIKILRIEGNDIFCEWEGRRWKARLTDILAQAIMSPDIDDEMRGRFVARLNTLLQQQETFEEEKNRETT